MKGGNAYVLDSEEQNDRPSQVSGGKWGTGKCSVILNRLLVEAIAKP